jgi:hypothetical protein
VVQGSTFQVEKSPNSSYQRDSVFIIFKKPSPTGVTFELRTPEL